MPFGKGTHSKRRFRPYTLDFYTKVQVWGSLVRASLQVPSISKAIQKNDDVSSTLLYIKKGEKRRAIKKRKKSGAKKRERNIYIYIYKRRKRRRERRSRLAPHGHHKHQSAAWLHQEFSSSIPLLFTTKTHGPYTLTVSMA